MNKEEIYNYIVNYGKKSINLEKSREKRIFITSKNLLIVNIILLIISSKCHFFIIPFLSLICIIQSQWFYKKYYLNSPKDFEIYLNKISEYSKMEWYYQQIDDDTKIFNKLLNSNNRKTKWLICSIILLYINLFEIFVYFIFK